MKKLTAFIKRLRLNQVLTVFLAGILLLVSTACSNSGPGNPLSSNRASDVREDVPKNATDSQYEGGMNQYSDVDPRFNEKPAQSKAKSLIDKAERNLNQNSVDSKDQFARNYRQGKPVGERVNEIGKDVNQSTQETAEDFTEGAQRGISNLKQNASDFVKGTQRTAEDATEGAKFKASRAASNVKEGVNSASNRAEETAEQVADRTSNLAKQKTSQASRGTQRALDDASRSVGGRS